MASATDEVAMIRDLIVAAVSRGGRQWRLGVASPAALLDLPGRKGELMHSRKKGIIPRFDKEF